MSWFQNLYTRFFHKKTNFELYLQQILGFSPKNLLFYQLAFQHKSQQKENNERLEFLGDAILDAVISKLLYDKFSQKTEGELTQLRSKIVSRTFLNNIGKQLKLKYHLNYKITQIAIEETNILGNTFEALVGAIYLDGGYPLAERFLHEQIVAKHINWNQLTTKLTDFKSKIIQYAQKNDKIIQFDLIQESSLQANKIMFEISLKIDDKEIARGKGSSKKKAEQAAAEKAYVLLGR